jgi:hypothetical protein
MYPGHLQYARMSCFDLTSADGNCQSRSIAKRLQVFYLVKVKYASCAVPSANFIDNLRQVPTHALSVFHT